MHVCTKSIHEAIGVQINVEIGIKRSKLSDETTILAAQILVERQL